MSELASVVENNEQAAPGAPESDSDTEEIERLAHQYWRERGSPIGTPDEDWFRAEHDIRMRRQLMEESVV